MTRGRHSRKRQGTSANVPTELVRRAEKSGDEQPIHELRALAATGDPLALAALASAYREGVEDSSGNELVRANPRLASRYETLAAQAGHAGSMTALANDLINKHPQSAAARTLYRSAYARGDITAAYNLAATFQNMGNFKQAVTWFRRALRGGDISALLPLARAELFGLGTRRNIHAAVTKLRRLADSELELHPPYWLQCEAMIVLADAYISGWPLPRDYKRGVQWLERAAELNSAPAKALLQYHTGGIG